MPGVSRYQRRAIRVNLTAKQSKFRLARDSLGAFPVKLAIWRICWPGDREVSNEAFGQQGDWNGTEALTDRAKKSRCSNFHSAFNIEAGLTAAARRAGSHPDNAATPIRQMAATAIEIGSAAGTR